MDYAFFKPIFLWKGGSIFASVSLQISPDTSFYHQTNLILNEINFNYK